MKTYVKPNLNQTDISANIEIASLNTWLQDNGMATYENSITTYQYNS